MATKKERKTVRRDGVGSSIAEAHRISELDACQKLLEGGMIGARIYSGPSIVGAFRTRQDSILGEMKWVAVDMFQQRKLAIAHCELVTRMVRKYWGERSRGSLSAAASMVQSYWLSVAKEIRAPFPSSLQKCAVFKLNTLQSIRPSGSPRSLSVPSSLLPTPTASGTLLNGLEDTGGEHKKALAHGLVHDWLNDMESQAPPTAEGTTGLADFCVQILKHNLREDSRSSAPRGHSHPKEANHNPEEQLTAAGGVPENSGSDFMIAMDPFMGGSTSYCEATWLALESGVQQILSQSGVEGFNCVKNNLLSPQNNITQFTSRALLSSAAVEAQRTLLQELAATNIMSRAPQLFGLAASLVASVEAPAKQKPLAVDVASRNGGQTKRLSPVVEDQGGGGGKGGIVQHKHYFVSVIFSTFIPVAWEPIEDIFLRETVKQLEEVSSYSIIDWSFVATSVNWLMKTWFGYDLLRTAIQCSDRFLAFRRKDDNKTSIGSGPSQFVPLPLLPRRRAARHNTFSLKTGGASSHDKQSSSSYDEIISSQQDAFFFKSKTPSSSRALANPFERRGVYSVSKPPASAYAQLFFHQVTEPLTLIARGASSSKKNPITHHPAAAILVQRPLLVRKPPPSGLAPVLLNLARTTHPNSLVSKARQEQIDIHINLKQKVIAARAKSDSPKRAFSVEDMIRKNTSAVPGYLPQYISGQLVCPVHPSFANMTRIAEMTLNRLIGSVSEQPPATTHHPPPSIPVPVETLFNYCTLFRKKYPAVFTSQHKVTKPSMPQLRPSMTPGPPTKMVTRQQAVAHRQQPVVPPTLPTQSTSNTPAEPIDIPPPAPQNADSRMVQRSKRASAPASRSSNSPTNESAPTPTNPNAFMVAGGPSLYGQFGRTRAPGR